MKPILPTLLNTRLTDATWERLEMTRTIPPPPPNNVQHSTLKRESLCLDGTTLVCMPCTSVLLKKRTKNRLKKPTNTHSAKFMLSISASLYEISKDFCFHFLPHSGGAPLKRQFMQFISVPVHFWYLNNNKKKLESQHWNQACSNNK